MKIVLEGNRRSEVRRNANKCQKMISKEMPESNKKIWKVCQKKSNKAFFHTGSTQQFDSAEVYAYTKITLSFVAVPFKFS